MITILQARQFAQTLSSTAALAAMVAKTPQDIRRVEEANTLAQFMLSAADSAEAAGRESIDLADTLRALDDAARAELEQAIVRTEAQ